MADVQRSRYALVGDEAQELIERRRRRKRSDPERVEEVRHEADPGRNCTASRRERERMVSRHRASEGDDQHQGHDGETDEEQRMDGHWGSYDAASSRVAAALKYEARGWCMTIAAVDCSGTIAKPSVKFTPMFAVASSRRKTVACCSRAGHAP